MVKSARLGLLALVAVEACGGTDTGLFHGSGDPCESNSDCREAIGTQCIAGKCSIPIDCSSDEECSGEGLVCDFSRRTCVQCITHTDCRSKEFCSGQTCTDDVCTPHSYGCRGSAIVRCNAEGDGWSQPLACNPPETCVLVGNVARCGSPSAENGGAFGLGGSGRGGVSAGTGGATGVSGNGIGGQLGGAGSCDPFQCPVCEGLRSFECCTLSDGACGCSLLPGLECVVESGSGGRTGSGGSMNTGGDRGNGGRQGNGGNRGDGGQQSSGGKPGDGGASPPDSGTSTGGASDDGGARDASLDATACLDGSADRCAQ